MNAPQPTSEEIEELVAFLPQLYKDGFTPVKRWVHSEKDESGTIQLGWPEYHNVVEEFFRVASMECWTDFDYNPGNACRMLENGNCTKAADLNQVKTMLTFCVRGAVLLRALELYDRRRAYSAIT